MGIFDDKRKRPELNKTASENMAEKAEKASEEMQKSRESRNAIQVMRDGFLNMGDIIRDAATGYIERKRENKQIYQENYREAEKEAIAERARKDARGTGEERERGGALQGLAEGLNSVGNAFQQPPEERRRKNREDRRRRDRR